jgi:prepilin-type N-terminal cleavage/methylation domain-containing protein
MSAGKPTVQGFTLIELMVVIAIVAVFAGLAAPSMRELISSSRLRGASSEFYAALLAARSEAIKRRANAVVEPVDTTWNTGWTVKVGGNVYLRGDPLPADVAVQVNATADTTSPITYAMNGRVSSASQTNIIFYNASLPLQARCVGIDPSGLPRIRMDTNRVGTDGCN